MIITSNVKEASIFVPRNIYTFDGDIKLILINRGTNQEYEMNDLDLQESVINYGYYYFTIDLDNIPSGEYEYKLIGTDSVTDEEFVLSRGIIRINELNQDIIYFNKNTEYVTYEQ